jgi:pimeloyl-ACP methyl ester carboxylesterase
VLEHMTSHILLLCCVLSGTCIGLHLLARCCHMSRTRRAVHLFGASPWLPSESSLPSDKGFKGESVEFTANDGLVLRGDYLPTLAAQCMGSVLFCHAFNGHRWSEAHTVDRIRACGFDVLTFDQRNHGESDDDAHYQSTPWISRRDVDDLLSAVDYLADRSDTDAESIGLFGVQKGGLTALCAAAEDPRIRSLIVDSVAMNPGASNGHLTAVRFGILEDLARRRLFLPILSLLGVWHRRILGFWCGCRFLNVRRSVRRVHQPVLWIVESSTRPLRTRSSRLRCLRFSCGSDGESAIGETPRDNSADSVTSYDDKAVRFLLRSLAPSDPVQLEAEMPMEAAAQTVLLRKA